MTSWDTKGTKKEPVPRLIEALAGKKVIGASSGQYEYPDFCQKGATVVDVYKTGVCVQCDYDVFPHRLARETNDSSVVDGAGELFSFGNGLWEYGPPG